MRELTTEVRAANRDQDRANKETQAALRTLTATIAQIETSTDREQWMDELQAKIVKRTAGGLTFMAGLAGLAFAIIDHF